MYCQDLYAIDFTHPNILKNSKSQAADSLALTTFNIEHYRKGDIDQDIKRASTTDVDPTNLIWWDARFVNYQRNQLDNMPQAIFLPHDTTPLVRSAFSITVCGVTLLARLLCARPKSSSVIFVTGPSRISDIEMQTIRGVHGPREVHVIVF